MGAFKGGENESVYLVAVDVFLGAIRDATMLFVPLGLRESIKRSSK